MTPGFAPPWFPTPLCLTAAGRSPPSPPLGTGRGVRQVLARHVAHLFVRDPLVLYHERLCQDNSADNDHFENLQSTNWNTVRFKPPPSAANNALDIKWRVEFRPMEVGLTDFENAAFAAFTVLISRAILDHGERQKSREAVSVA